MRSWLDLPRKSQTQPSTPLSSSSEESLPPGDVFHKSRDKSRKHLPILNPRVLAIIDDFQNATIPIGRYANGKIVMTSHGALVEAHARAAAPHLRFLRFQTTPSPKGHAITFPGDALEALKQHLQKGKKINAVNLSSAHEPRISSLQKHYGIPELTVENIGDYRERILDELPPHVLQVLDDLENVAQACPVFASAGNHSNHTFNLYLLARGVTGVGAETSDHKPEAFSANSRWVKEWGPNGKVAIPAKRKGASGFQLVDPAKLKARKLSGNAKPFAGASRSASAMPPMGERIDLPASDTICVPQSIEDFPDEEWTSIGTPGWLPNCLHGTSFASPDKAAQYTKMGRHQNPFLSFVNKKTSND